MISKAVRLVVLALSLFCVVCNAQERKTKAYYNNHSSEIFPDAQSAFKKGEYEWAGELCEWYYIIVGKNDADMLRARVGRCITLVREMKELETAGAMREAKNKAAEILALNPDDPDAKRVFSFDETRGFINGHEWVDLGLSVKWAACNVGASSPSEYGMYFAWGEIVEKEEYTWKSYRFRIRGNSPESATFSHYNTKKGKGVVDNRTLLLLDDDAAFSNWGGDWRIPTRAEWDELLQKCVLTWTRKDGVLGALVTSSINGNSIFLPAAGYRQDKRHLDEAALGHYWSSTLNSDSPHFAYRLFFTRQQSMTYNSFRSDGFSIRPVRE